MKKITKQKPNKLVKELEESLCKRFQTDLSAHKNAQALRHSQIKLYETVGIFCFALLVNVAVYNHNYAASLCLIPDVWAMYKLFRML